MRSTAPTLILVLPMSAVSAAIDHRRPAAGHEATHPGEPAKPAAPRKQLARDFVEGFLSRRMFGFTQAVRGRKRRESVGCA